MWRAGICLLIVLTANVGCRVCDSPYDYSGPVVPCGQVGAPCHGGCSSCGSTDGEVIHPTMPQSEPTMAPTEVIPSARAMPSTTRQAQKPAVRQSSHTTEIRKPIQAAARQRTQSVPAPATRGPIRW